MLASVGCPEPEFRARSAQFFFINFVICPPNFEKFSLKIYGVTGFDARLETQKFLEICPQKGRAAANRTVERCCCRVRSQVHMRYECVRAEALLHSMRRPKLSRTLALRCRSQVPRSAVAGRARSQNTHRYRTRAGLVRIVRNPVYACARGMYLCICILDWLMGAAGHGQDDGDRCRGTRPPRIVPHLAGGEAAADESCEAAQCVSLPARRPHTTSRQLRQLGIPTCYYFERLSE